MMQTIVIVGGGAGGLELATRLGDQSGKRGIAKIVLIDPSPTHFWKPLLHEVASGKIDPKSHQVEYSAQAAEHYFQFICGEVTNVDRTLRLIELAPAAMKSALKPCRRAACRMTSWCWHSVR
jgi:NADH dehydrogenase